MLKGHEAESIHKKAVPGNFRHSLFSFLFYFLEAAELAAEETALLAAELAVEDAALLAAELAATDAVLLAVELDGTV